MDKDSLDKVIRGIEKQTNQHVKLDSLSKPLNDVIASSFKNAERIADLSKLASSIVPKIPTSALAVPDLTKAMNEALKPLIDQNISSKIQPLLDGHSASIRKAIEAMNSVWSDELSNIAKNVRKLVSASFPSNWKEDENTLPLPLSLEELVLDEGLPLAWVPPHRVLKKLFAAGSRRQRRNILYNNKVSILKSCTANLKRLRQEELSSYRDFALEAIQSIHSGHWSSSQALSTNLLDSIIRRYFDNDSRIELTSHKNGRRIDWQKYPLKRALVFSGIWGSYSEYWPDSVNENIPRKYTRHATTHAVSSKQYTKINSLIAVMHVTSLLVLIDEEY